MRGREHLHVTLIFFFNSNFDFFFFKGFTFGLLFAYGFFSQTNFSETLRSRLLFFSFSFSFVTNDSRKMIILTVLIAVLTWFLLCIVYAFLKSSSPPLCFFVFRCCSEAVARADS